MMPITHLFSRFYSIFQTARLKLEANLLRPHQKLITSDIIPYKYSYSFEKQFDENHQDNLGNLSVNGYIELLYHAMLGSNYSDNFATTTYKNKSCCVVPPNCDFPNSVDENVLIELESDVFACTNKSTNPVQASLM